MQNSKKGGVPKLVKYQIGQVTFCSYGVSAIQDHWGGGHKSVHSQNKSTLVNYPKKSTVVKYQTNDILFIWCLCNPSVSVSANHNQWGGCHKSVHTLNRSTVMNYPKSTVVKYQKKLKHRQKLVASLWSTFSVPTLLEQKIL